MSEAAVTPIPASPTAADAAPRRGALLPRLWRHRKLFAVAFGATLGLTVLALLVIPVRYFANGSVIVAEQEPSIANASAAWAQKIGDPADLESQLLVIRSPRTLRLAMASPDAMAAALQDCRHRAETELLGRLSGAARCNRLETDADALIDYVQARYVVGSVGRSRVINIGYKSPLPDVARRMANALITAFLDDHRASISTGREVAAVWLRQELAQLNDALRDEDAKIQAFRRAKGLMRGTHAPIASERLTNITQQLSAADAARADAAARLEEIRADQARGSSDSPSVLASRIVADLKQQISVVGGQLGSSSSVLGPRHPSRLALQQELESLQQRLKNEVASIAASVQQSLLAAEALVVSLQRQMEEVKTEVSNATSNEASIESMVRGTEIKRQQYADLYKRASELETERRVLLGSTRLVTLADLPLTPFFPKTVPFLAAGFTLALMLGFGAALWRDRMAQSPAPQAALPPAVVPAAAWTPAVLAVLPLLRIHGARTMPPLRADMPGGVPSLAMALRLGQLNAPLQNALGQLHARLTAGGDRPLRTILVTSPGADDGKSFTTLALAQFAAVAGQRVLVVECDLGHPAFEKALGIIGRYGLADVLRGTIAPREAAFTTELATLDQIAAGRMAGASTALIQQPAMAALLDWAGSYDLVLLDGPPAGDASAAVLARLVDGVVCCGRSDRPPALVAAAASALRVAGGHVLGTVTTMVDQADQPANTTTPAGAYLKAS